MRKLLAVAPLFFLYLFAAPYCFSQPASNSPQPQDRVASGTIRGTFTDWQGSPLAGASVKVANTQSGATFEVKTDREGAFKVSDLPFGKYEVIVTAEGFKSLCLVDLFLDEKWERVQEGLGKIAMDPGKHEILGPTGSPEAPLEGMNIVPESVGVRPRRVFVAAIATRRRAYKAPTKRRRTRRLLRGQ